jgi:hypothetical protein
MGIKKQSGGKDRGAKGRRERMNYKTKEIM